MRGGEKKSILRGALRGVAAGDDPRRPQAGVRGAAVARWLRSDLRAFARDVLLDPGVAGARLLRPAAVDRLLDRHAAGADDDAKRIYSLLMLELWHREYVDAPTLALPVAA